MMVVDAVQCQDRPRIVAVLPGLRRPRRVRVLRRTRRRTGTLGGAGLTQLGLEADGPVLEQQMEALLARGLHPRTGEALGRAWRADAVTEHDLTFSAPESVSALWALAIPATAAQIREAHTEAVKAALPTAGLRRLLAAFDETWPYAKVQRCLVHVQRNVRTHLTTRPRTDAGKTLWGLARSLTRIENQDRAITWLTHLNTWHEVHGHLTRQRTYDTGLTAEEGLWHRRGWAGRT